MKKILLTVVVLVFGSASGSHAFPEMVRHGYPNCVSCHVSPAGGGILTPYGRAISAELLSSWGSENEGKFLYGAIDAPESISFGADFRALSVGKTATRGRFLLMQSDFEGAFAYRRATAVATVGYRSAGPRGESVLSRRHYAQYQLSDMALVRAGRFLTAFGLMPADHRLVTRSGIGWDQGSETYNVEASYSGEDFDGFATAQLGSPFDGDNREQGVAVRLAGHFWDTNRIGLSYFYGNDRGTKRHLLGPYLALGLSRNFFILGEFDYQRIVQGSVSGGAAYVRVDYEFVQGAHAYLTSEYARRDIDQDRTTTRTHGVGLQWFPRPHFEFNAQLQKQQVRSTSADFTTLATLMMHIYL